LRSKYFSTASIPLNKTKTLAKWRMRLLQQFFHTAVDRTKDQKGNLYGKYLEQAFKRSGGGFRSGG
jgi:hypothetical protein